MIVDTHVHVWEIDPPRYPVGPTAPTWTAEPDEPGTADELIEDMNANGVDASVLVQTSWSTWDNGYMSDSVARFPDRFVGHGLIDPQDTEGNAEQVRYWMEDRGLVGFRFHPFYYPDEQILVKEDNRAMWEELAARDAVVQFHMRPGDAHQVDEIARRHPDMTLIIDHMGYPDPETGMEVFQPIIDLARHDRMFVKISDVKGRSQEPFPFRDMHPFVRALLDAFGVERAMWGTGYPGHHRVKHNWLSLADELLLVREGYDFLTGDQKDRLLGGTAAEVWGLG
ncbi:MAG: amidohydrolase family protein [candidate division Zixibacteria bacterium]|nr:amidohydrolase family protein [candidate division Zixibacteria bacterium]